MEVEGPVAVSPRTMSARRRCHAAVALSSDAGGESAGARVPNQVAAGVVLSAQKDAYGYLPLG